MADQDAHFRVMDAALKHADGRAKGGEPCVVCGEPVPPTAHWGQRDRHVCSTHCNSLLRRRYGRGSATIDAARVEAAKALVGPRPNPRTTGPRIFQTVPSELIPIEWEGYGPIPGDVVERYGIITRFQLVDTPATYYTTKIFVSIADTYESFIVGANPDGSCSRLEIGAHSPTGERHVDPNNHVFLVNGVLCEWRRENITDLQPDGIDYYTWECIAAAPVIAPKYPPSMQSPRYRTEMDRRKRVSSNTSRHERRARGEARIELFDPLDIYVRDEWMCQICGTEVDRGVLYPDSRSATLDHVVPLSRGGDHTPENTVLAHLRCNLVKSAN